MRINHICDLMRRLQWVRGKTAHELAEAWGLALNTVEQWAAEAWRRVCAEATDAEEKRPDVCVIVDEALRRAFEAGEYSNVAKLADVYTRIIGAQAPRKVEHSGAIARVSDPMSVADKHEAIARALRAQKETN